MSVSSYTISQLDALRNDSLQYLTDKRKSHVLGCEQEAVLLAKRWGAREDLAAAAGILHDITKRFSVEEHNALAQKHQVVFDETEKKEPKLLHSRTGCLLAQDLYEINDEVFSAIQYHTTGRENMTLLEKVIYIADYIEPTRDFPGVEKLRKLAYEDLDQAMILGLEMSLEEVQAKGGHPHERTKKALKDLKKGAVK